MSKIVKARYENGVLKLLEPVDLKEGEKVIVELREDIVEFARRIRKQIHVREEPSEILSRERERFK